MRPSVHPTTARLIGELGVRFKPRRETDLASHAEALRLLVEDVADVPVAALEAACRTWTRTKSFLPKAAELRMLADDAQREHFAGTDTAGQQLQDHCNRLNAMRTDKHWFVVGEAPNRSVANGPRAEDRRDDRCTPDEAEQIMRQARAA